jgi:UDP:flavonoid glycosyltransferase YjiC (YdhE family)
LLPIHILGHPYALALVNHGGLNGVYEALYHKVPIVGLPLFGDQFDTMVRVQEKKMGIFLNWKKLSASKLDHAIRTVISSPEYVKIFFFY